MKEPRIQQELVQVLGVIFGVVIVIYVAGLLVA